MDFGLAFEYFVLGKDSALMPLLSSVIGVDADAGLGGVLSSVLGSSEGSGKNSGGSSGLLSSVLSS